MFETFRMKVDSSRVEIVEEPFPVGALERQRAIAVVVARPHRKASSKTCEIRTVKLRSGADAIVVKIDSNVYVTVLCIPCGHCSHSFEPTCIQD